MKRTLILLILFLLTLTSALAQYVVRDGSELLKLKKLPQEKAYLDHTGPVIFSGEYIHYSFFCFNTQNNKLSNISKIGYVALVNQSKEYIFEQKIRLNQGTGNGDVFLPTDIPSGKYKLLGYTQWMKNSGISQIFKDDIIIVNPYLADQSALLGNNASSVSSTRLKVTGTVAMDSSILSLQVNGDKFGTRQKVRLSIRNYKNKLGYGTYSVKVKQKKNLGIDRNLSAIDYGTEYLNVDNEIPQRIGDSLFLPEQRGELFFGSVLDRVTNEPVPDVPVVISIPGKEYLMKFSQSDGYGNFYSYLRKEYKNDVAIVQAEEGDKLYSINKGKHVDLDISNLEFTDFTMSSAYANDIIKRSVHNQIENQFFAAKPDSIIQGDPIDPFDGAVPEVVVLDDYTRFPTFGETMLEIVKFAGYRGGGIENDYIRVAQDFESYNEEYNSFPAIVLFDGVFVPNHEDVKDYDARKIKKIGVIQDQFRMGGKDYQGIVSVETFDGDFYDGYSAENAVTMTLSPPVQNKNYFTQTYSDNDSTYARIPDYRSLLLWKPHVVILGTNMNFEFYTSDIEGEYEIILNGFTTYGKPISISKSIEVSSSMTKL